MTVLDNHTILEGDAQLFDLARNINWEYDVIEWLVAAHCWDHYGLPDGSHNPTHSSASSGHLTVEPTERAIEVAFNSVLSEMLYPSEMWLLNIPRRVANLGTVDARVIRSTTGTAAIALPRGLFGMLFCANEVYWDVVVDYSAILPSRIRKLWRIDYQGLLALCLLSEHSKNWSIPVIELDALRYRRKANAANGIWATTMIQQVFILLHELGHLACANHLYYNESQDVYSSLTPRLRDELAADKWALQHISHFEDHFPSINREFILHALLVLLAMMESLHQNGNLVLEPSHINERCLQIVESLYDETNIMHKESAHSITELIKDVDRFFLQVKEIE